MELDRETVQRLVETIWMGVLHLDICPADDPAPAGPDDVLRGRVAIAGRWEGAVLLDCPAALARRVAGRMADAAPAALTDDDVRDALGELTNVIGGNLKAMLPGPSRLGLPAVGPAVGRPDTPPRLEAAFWSGGYRFRVALAGPAGAA